VGQAGKNMRAEPAQKKTAKRLDSSTSGKEVGHRSAGAKGTGTVGLRRKKAGTFGGGAKNETKDGQAGQLEGVSV